MKRPNIAERHKLIAVVVVISLAAIWILTYLLTSGNGYRTGKPLDTPGWNAANDFTKKLTADSRFADIGISVVSESPLKLKVEGVLHPPTTVQDLEKYVQENPIQAEIEYNVTISQH